MKQKVQTVLREMSESDIPRVSEILTSCYQFTAIPDGISPIQLKSVINERGSIEAVKKQFKEYSWIVACHCDEVIGLIAITNNEIAKLYVDPTYHRCRVGDALYNAAEKIIKDSGFESIFLGTTGFGEKFYLTKGFKITGHKICSTGPIKGNQVILMEKKF